MPTVELHRGDALEVLRDIPDETAHSIITSPPYWNQRDYGVAGQIGLERTPDEFINRLTDIFREARRVLRGDGTLWLNLGDSHAVRWSSRRKKGRSGLGDQERERPENPASFWATNGLKPKDLIGIPWRVAFALQADGWWLRSDVVWEKPNVKPESVRDRPTRSHEYLFLLTKSARYRFDQKAVRQEAVGKNHHDLTGTGYRAPGQSPEKGNRKAIHGPTYSRHRSSIPGGQSLQAAPDGKRNIRTVWRVPTVPYKDAHFATFPPKLIEPCIAACTPPGGIILDPFAGTGTTGATAIKLGRSFIGIELKPDYLELAERRIAEAHASLLPT